MKSEKKQCKQRADENIPKRGILLRHAQDSREMLLHNFSEMTNNIFIPKTNKRSDSDVKFYKYYYRRQKLGDKNWAPT